MDVHFNSFTADAMHAFGQELAAEHQQRLELIEATRAHTHTLLANANRQRLEVEAHRRQQAVEAADARRLFTSELRSGVHALRNRFELARRDMAADFQRMADESRAARKAFQNRPGRKVEVVARRTPRSAAPQPKHSEPPVKAESASHDHANPRPAHSAKPGHFKKRQS